MISKGTTHMSDHPKTSTRILQFWHPVNYFFPRQKIHLVGNRYKNRNGLGSLSFQLLKGIHEKNRKRFKN